MTQIDPTNLPADYQRVTSDPAATQAEKQQVADRLYVLNFYLGSFLYFCGMVLIVVAWLIADGPFYNAIAGLVACFVGAALATPGARVLFGKKKTEQADE
jgi:hypothetical protein